MSQEILIATHNQHKKEEIQQILGNDFSVTSLADYDLHEEIVEDGNSFHENALIKAKYCFEKTGETKLGRRFRIGGGSSGWKTWDLLRAVCGKP